MNKFHRNGCGSDSTTLSTANDSSVGPTPEFQTLPVPVDQLKNITNATRLLPLLMTLGIVSGLGTVVLSAQVEVPIKAAVEVSAEVVKMQTAQLLAFVTVLALFLCGWTQYVLLKLSNELHQRPCYYKLAEEEARHEKSKPRS